MTENQKLREALRFTKKPVTIEAVQFTEALRDAILFDGEPCPAGVKRGATTLHPPTRKVWRAEFFIPTLEGAMNVSVGDWIIKGVKGEYYPCKPDIFAATYEPEALALPTAGDCIRIPTDAMEQEFQNHYRHGFEAGKRAALPTAAPAQLTDEQTLKDAYQEGYYARVTYNDAEESDLETEWSKSSTKAIIAAIRAKGAV